MTQPTEAVGGEAAAPVDAATTPEEYFEQLAADEFGLKDDEEPAEGDEGQQPEATEEAEDEPQLEEEADDLPPIEAPVSWDAEAKEMFANLPREAQEIVAKRESERERFVQQKSQEATRAKQDAIQQATAELAQIEQSYSQHFQSLAEQILPQRPNPALIQHDPQAFYAQQAQYEAAVAQQRELQQQAQTYAHQAQARAAQIEQAEQAEQHRIIVENFPEYADPTTGPELQRKLTAAAKRIGYTDELISQARAQDILSMRVVADALEKADKYDALQKNKMEKVRAAKALPKVASPGVAQGQSQLRANATAAAINNLRQTGSLDAAAAVFKTIL